MLFSIRRKPKNTGNLEDIVYRTCMVIAIQAADMWKHIFSVFYNIHEWLKHVFEFAVCVIEAMSWGYDDITTSNGYIAVNGNKLLTTPTPTRGFVLMQLKVSSCASSSLVIFDTCTSTTASNNMATYINGIPSLDTVLIGVTADDSQRYLTANAKSALLAIGVNVNALQYRGKVSFVTQIGQPAISVSQMAPAGGNSVKITVSVTG